MSRRGFWSVLLVPALLASALLPAHAAEVQTAHLTVSDPAGRIPPERLAERAARMQDLFDTVLALWEADPGLDQGRIRVVLIPPGRGLQLSVFRFAREGGRTTREVLVAPADGPPQMLVHKLTSALFPSRDKLVRNMMGEAAEARLGNARAFPSCGISPDAWVLALRRLGLYLPMAELGPDHEAWGMGENDKGVPFTRDPDRHHRTYAEAASFGRFLFDRYGMAKLKQFCANAGGAVRPWSLVYGVELDALEAQWLDALAQDAVRLEPDVALTAALYAKDPASACDRCQQARP